MRRAERAGQAVEASAAQEPAEREIRERCTNVVAVLQVLVALVAVGGTIVQVLLAIRVSRYAQVLARREAEREERVREAERELGWGYVKGYRDSAPDGDEASVKSEGGV